MVLETGVDGSNFGFKSIQTGTVSSATLAGFPHDEYGVLTTKTVIGKRSGVHIGGPNAVNDELVLVCTGIQFESEGPGAVGAFLHQVKRGVPSVEGTSQINSICIRSIIRECHVIAVLSGFSHYRNGKSKNHHCC